MNDMTPVIIPKSDQINADDLISGPMTITIQSVSVRPGTEQPVSIAFGEPSGKVFRPCKSMARVMVAAWGPDSAKYAGKSMTLYRDPKVKWGGLEVGGIRISHMSDIQAAMTMALTESKANRRPFTVKPLTVSAARTPPPADDAIPILAGETSDWADDLEARIDAATKKREATEIFNAVIKSDEWSALRTGDAGRAQAIKDKVMNWK